MTFKLFVYYCALCGGWAALLAFMLVQSAGIGQSSGSILPSTIIAGILGLLLAGAVGTLDALLNSGGRERFRRVLVCLGVGVVGGLIGGLVGAVLVAYLSLPRFLGWIILGMAIGASIGIFDMACALRARQGLHMALRKVGNGAIGGALGGLVGGWLFETLRGNQTLPRASLAIGMVVLGSSIGLLIGLAQIILKEAWVKVEQGFRAGREMMLSKPEITIGRAESCDLGLFGDNTIERAHARIVLQGNHYFLEDAGSTGGTFLNDEPVTRQAPLRSGDAIRIGNSILRFGERKKRDLDAAWRGSPAGNPRTLDEGKETKAWPR